jgi:hypothetical protein
MKVAFAVTVLMLSAAAWADSGVEQGHASADSQSNGCSAATLAAKQNIPRNADITNVNCTCDSQRNAMGRIDCLAMVAWRSRK